MTPHGDLQLDGETVCFDLACALEMAESDCEWAAGACVYTFDPTLEMDPPRLLAALGLSAPSDEGRHSCAGTRLLHIA